MKNKFLGIICILYGGIIIYVRVSNCLKNFLAPSMQIYILLSIVPLFIMGLVLCINNNITYRFKLLDLVLLLPIVMLLLAGDGRLSMNLSSNRSSMISKKSKVVVDIVEDDIEEDSSIYDFSSVDFDVIDESYDGLSNFLTYNERAKKYVGKTIRVRGFTNMDAEYIPKGYFAIGKYSITCCAADASFIGFISKYKGSDVKNNTWYEIEGVLKEGKDGDGMDILTVNVINLKEIDGSKEEQYVYPCYAYDDGKCSEMQKYDLN